MRATILAFLHGESLANLEPALAELAPIDHNDRVTSRTRVDHRCLHGAGARRGQDQHLLCGLEQPPQPLLHLGKELTELRSPMMDERLGHAQQHFWWNRGGARSQQVAF